MFCEDADRGDARGLDDGEAGPDVVARSGRVGFVGFAAGAMIGGQDGCT